MAVLGQEELHNVGQKGGSKIYAVYHGDSKKAPSAILWICLFSYIIDALSGASACSEFTATVAIALATFPIGIEIAVGKSLTMGKARTLNATSATRVSGRLASEQSSEGTK